jgi:hypothetical protein
MLGLGLAGGPADRREEIGDVDSYIDSSDSPSQDSSNFDRKINLYMIENAILTVCG